MGAYIEYQDVDELRNDFLEELADSIVNWIYNAKKFAKLKKKAMEKGKSEAAATQEIRRTLERAIADKKERPVIKNGTNKK